MKDKDFYGGGEHPEAGSELVYINGKWHDTYDIYHPKCKSKYSEKVKNTTQKKIEKKTVNSVGFSKGKKTTDILPEDHDPVEAQRQRLVLLQSEASRLEKQLETTRKIIQMIKDDLINAS